MSIVGSILHGLPCKTGLVEAMILFFTTQGICRRIIAIEYFLPVILFSNVISLLLNRNVASLTSTHLQLLCHLSADPSDACTPFHNLHVNTLLFLLCSPSDLPGCTCMRRQRAKTNMETPRAQGSRGRTERLAQRDVVSLTLLPQAGDRDSQ